MMPRDPTHGSGIMMAESTSNPTAELLLGGLLHGGSFNDGGHGDHGSVYYPSAQAQAHNQHWLYPAQSVTTMAYPAHESEPTVQQSSYGASFLTPALSTMSQQALEAARALPLTSLDQEHMSWLNQEHMSLNQEHMSLYQEHMSLNQEHTGGHALGGSLQEPQNHQSLFGAQVSCYGDMPHEATSHDLSHVHQTDQFLQNGVGSHMDRQSQRSSVYGQSSSLLSLSLSSQQSYFQLPESELHMNAFAQAAAAQEAIARTKEVASRYLGVGVTADLMSRFRNPCSDDDMGFQFQQELAVPDSHGVRKPQLKPTNVQSGPSDTAGPSNPLTASTFLKSVKNVLEEVCSIAALVPAKGTRGMAPAATAPTTVNGTPEMLQSLADAACSGTESGRAALENKKTKLKLMIREIETRYGLYSDRLKLAYAGFNSHAGPNSATPYTILARKTMSGYFRCLKDAVKSQLKVVRRALGEAHAPTKLNVGETSRLQYLDQQICQQRALRQLQQNAWRPHHPERAVSIMRAWLFEHFLHPYPKDGDKMFLAKQTRLTRGQVSNWFINARVRLWKPMVEEMYMEEQRKATDQFLAERIANEQGIPTYQEGKERDGGPSQTKPDQVQSLQLVLLTRQADVGVGKNHFHHKGREAKKARNSASEAFDSSRALINLHPTFNPHEGEKSAFSPKGEDNLDKLKLKGIELGCNRPA